MPLTRGDRLGPYAVLSAIGAGGMGEVYRAHDSKLNRDVAIKVLPAALANDADYLARFQREAQALAALHHPNIASIFGLEENAIVMELVHGEPLRGPMPIGEALPLAHQIAEALEAAHDKGIIHRDLKPGNILVTAEGQVKVLDFGLAKAVEKPSNGSPLDSPTLSMRATEAGLILGTAGYMSPEQAAGKTVDKRADIWAFGVVLYELLTGKRLFEGETVSHTLAAVLKDPIDFAIPQAPPPIQHLLARCLDRNFKHRYKDISEARIAIEDYLANPKQQEVEAAKPATRPILWMAIAAIATLLAVTLWTRTPATPIRAIHFNLSENYTAAQISPDGKSILAVRDGLLHVRRLSNPNWTALKGTEGSLTISSFWSGDSSSIGFVSAGRLRIIQLDGSAPRELIAVEDFDGASWRGGRNDGMILLASNGKLRSYDFRTAKAQDLALAFKPGVIPSQPVFLPEGDGFVFLLNPGDGRRLFRSSLRAATYEPLLLTHLRAQFAKHPYTGKWHIFYQDGAPEQQIARILLTAEVDPKTGALLSEPLKLQEGVGRFETSAQFSVGEGGVITWRHTSAALPIWHIKWTDREGNLLAKVVDNKHIVSMALSPDETKIAAQLQEPDAHIWIFDAKTGAGSRISNVPTMELCPNWAPDSKSIFYLSLPQNSREIRRHYLDSSLKEDVLWQESGSNDSLSNVVLIGVTSDGQNLLVQTRNGKLNRLDLSTAIPRKLEPLESSEAFTSQTSISPNSSLLASPELDGGVKVLSYPRTSDPARRLHRGAREFFHPFFSHDGRTLYTSSNGNLVAIPIAPDRMVGEPKDLFPWRSPDRFSGHMGAASRDGNRLLLIDTSEKEKLTQQVLTDWTTLLTK